MKSAEPSSVLIEGAASVVDISSFQLFTSTSFYIEFVLQSSVRSKQQQEFKQANTTGHSTTAPIFS